MEELLEQIKVVIAARELAEKQKAIVASLKAAWEATHQTLIGLAASSQEGAEESEDLLRELTLKAYSADPTNKKPADGVGIRENTKYDYDPNEALKWAIEHKMALKLDETKFKNHVKADPPDFVTITTEPMATISANLEV